MTGSGVCHYDVPVAQTQASTSPSTLHIISLLHPRDHVATNASERSKNSTHCGSCTQIDPPSAPPCTSSSSPRYRRERKRRTALTPPVVSPSKNAHAVNHHPQQPLPVYATTAHDSRNTEASYQTANQASLDPFNTSFSTSALHTDTLVPPSFKHIKRRHAALYGLLGI